jgi:hypothetical protein
MLEPEIEVLLAKELRCVCISCAKFKKCPYRKSSSKIFIQCDLYELVEAGNSSRKRETTLRGLCINCCHADTCCLPEKEFGVWHCEEYE